MGKKADLLIIDPIYLMTPSDRKTDDPVGVISWDLKLLARGRDIPVIAASQFNRESHKRHLQGKDVDSVDAAFTDKLGHNTDIMIGITGDKETASLIRLFLSTALREAWEEIGLNPCNTVFLGALPSYSLTLLARTIFPVVCLTPKSFKYRLSSEVKKILEIPLSFFFNSANYAVLDIKTSVGKDTDPLQYQMPCLVIPDGMGGDDILWGATFNIINNFLRIISDDSLPPLSSSRTLNNVLTINYISGKT